MKKTGYGWVFCSVAGLAAAYAFGGVTSGQESAGNKARLLAHGKYLVTRAAPCSDCHSPRDEKGRFIAGRDLQGAPIDFEPLHPVADWRTAAPPIAGLPQGWSFRQTVHFLETGLMPRGGHAGPPMPPFRFNHHDAVAIAVYLQSLPSREVNEKP